MVVSTAIVCGTVAVIAIGWLVSKAYVAQLASARARDESNQRFLLLQSDSEKPESIETLDSLLKVVRYGHSPDCGYCSCGHSEAIKGLIKAKESGKKRREELRAQFEREMLRDGWRAPTDA